eukprot:563226-Pyramimonas_sp.AAC.1
MGGATHADPAASLWGHDPCEECAEMSGGTHAGPATVAFEGAPYGATTRVKDLPKWWARGAQRH